jgi:hypothetical protein
LEWGSRGKNRRDCAPLIKQNDSKRSFHWERTWKKSEIHLFYDCFMIVLFMVVFMQFDLVKAMKVYTVWVGPARGSLFVDEH